MAGERHGGGMGVAWARHAICESTFTLPDSRLQHFVHSSVSMNPSKGLYRGTGAALVDSCYIYSLLHSPHLLRSYKNVNLKLWSRQSCCYNLFSALHAPITLFSSPSNIWVSRSGISLSLVNKKVACKKAHPKNIVSNKGTPAFRHLRYTRREFKPFMEMRCVTHCSNLLGLSAGSN